MKTQYLKTCECIGYSTRMSREEPKDETNMEELEIRKRAIRLGENLWGSYVWISPIAKKGDYIIPLRLSKVNENTYILTFKLVKVEEREVAMDE